MFVFFIILTVVSFSTIQFISPIPKSTQIDYHCNYGATVLKFCPTSLDHCATDLFIENSLKNITSQYIFDVSKHHLNNSIQMTFVIYIYHAQFNSNTQSIQLIEI